MRILWLPHHHWGFIREGQREQRLAAAIEDVHDVHFLTWQVARPNPGSVAGALRSARWRDNGFWIHQMRRVPNFAGRRLHEASGRGLRVNEYLFGRAVRQIIANEKIELVVCGIGHQSVGLPPADLPVPLIFDYLDYKLERWPEIETAYFERADAVTCTSRVLLERAEDRHPHAYYLPNGVDLDMAAGADGARIRREYGLEDAKIVSLIGVTASARPFYVDAIADAMSSVPELVFLVVGDPGELGATIHLRAEERGVRIVATGPVPPSEVANFFAASDVGLYPGDKNPYFDAACPLKVLEYTAAEKPVVVTDLTELRNWGFPNVHLAEPTAEGFSREILRALGQPHDFPDLSEFSWPLLADRLKTIIHDVSARAKPVHS
jgi:glycosyltransferase involved in cell wall biosynthesis